MKFIDETRRLISDAMKGLDNSKRQVVWNSVWRMVDFLDAKQRLPLPVREKCNLVCTHIYNLLRKNKQVGRRVGAFDTEVRKAIFDIMSENIIAENHGKEID